MSRNRWYLTCDFPWWLSVDAKQVYYMFSFRVFSLRFFLLILTRMVLGYLVCVGGHILVFCLSHFPPSLLSLLYLRVLAYAMIMLYVVCLMVPYLNNSFTRVSSIIDKIVDSITWLPARVLTSFSYGWASGLLSKSRGECWEFIGFHGALNCACKPASWLAFMLNQVPDEGIVLF